MRYFKGTSKVCLCYRRANLLLKGYIDSYMARDVDSRKFTSGYLYTFAG